MSRQGRTFDRRPNRSQAEHLESADHILPQQHSFAGYTGGGGRAPRVTPAALREHFHLPLTEVAKKFNMCTTAFKKACRKQGIMQWPHRTLRSLEKKIATLMAETKFTKETDAIAAQVRVLATPCGGGQAWPCTDVSGWRALMREILLRRFGSSRPSRRRF